jgi:hypothetical protein
MALEIAKEVGGTAVAVGRNAIDLVADAVPHHLQELLDKVGKLESELKAAKEKVKLEIQDAVARATELAIEKAMEVAPRTTMRLSGCCRLWRES